MPLGYLDFSRREGWKREWGKGYPQMAQIHAEGGRRGRTGVDRFPASGVSAVTVESGWGRAQQMMTAPIARACPFWECHRVL